VPLAPTPRSRYTVVTVYGDYEGGGIYVRRTMSRGRGPYFHLGTHEGPEDALAAWPSEAEHLRKIGREGQAAKLEANLRKLRALTEAEKGKG
jgi:hypothetical protein